ncbi:MAG TPA: hypothetical protein VGJ72_03980 [Polaromonas sp.]
MSIEKHTPPPAGAHDKASIKNTIEKVNRQVKMLRTFDVSVAQDGWDSSMEALQKKINATLADSFGVGTPEYRQYAVATQDFFLDTTFGDRYSVEERQQKVKHGIDRAIAHLNAAKKLLTERLEGRAAAAPAAAPAAEAEPPPPASAPAQAPVSAPAPASSPVPTSAPAAAPAAEAEPPPPPPPAQAPVAVPIPAPSPVPTSAPVAAPTAEAEPPQAPAPAPAPAPAQAPVAAPSPAPSPVPATALTSSSPAVTMMPMSKADPASSSITAQQAVPGGRVAVLGWGGDDAAGQACELMEQLGLEAAVLDAVSVDQLEALRNVAFLLLLPGEDSDAPAAMLAIGFMLAVLGRNRIVCLLSEQGALPAALKGATRITVDETGLWRLLLAREMKRAGLDVDLNRAI